MSKRIIVIGREFGSGGHELGQRLAEELGIPFYDKELVAQASKSLEIDEMQAADIDETAISDLAAAYLSRCRTVLTAHRDYDRLSIGEDGILSNRMYQQQQYLIRTIAAKGSCVIVGRCADFILRDRRDVLSVFIHADRQSRISRIAARSVMSTAEAERTMDAVDKQRRHYYEKHTGRTWGDAESYHILLNASLLDMEESVHVLKALCSD